RPLQREDEILRCLLAPPREALGLLRAIVGAVDLDRGQLAARELELALLRKPLGIEASPPGFIGPAADSDADPSTAHAIIPPGLGVKRLPPDGPPPASAAGGWTASIQAASPFATAVRRRSSGRPRSRTRSRLRS